MYFNYIKLIKIIVVNLEMIVYNEYMNSYLYIKIIGGLKMREEINDCNCNIVYEEIVIEVKLIMLDEEMLYDLVELFKVFGDIIRVKILYVLFVNEMCVCDIVSLLNMIYFVIFY